MNGKQSFADLLNNLNSQLQDSYKRHPKRQIANHKVIEQPPKTERKTINDPVKELLEDVLEVDTRPYYYKPRAQFTDITCQCTRCKLICTLYAKRNGSKNILQLELEHNFHSTGRNIIHSCGGKVKLFGHLPPSVNLY